MIFLGFNVEIKKTLLKTGNSASLCPADKPVCDTTLLMKFGWPPVCCYQYSADVRGCVEKLRGASY